MLEFVLKSSACMAAFLLFYQFLLEQENMHQFKRFFLLSAIVLSLLIPNLVFTEYVEVMPSPLSPVPAAAQQQGELSTIEQATDMDVIAWSKLLWSVYVIGLIWFGLRFGRHLYQILSRIRNNPKLKGKTITKVLLSEQLPPHTFFRYVFLNNTDYTQKSIPDEVLLHEETHAKQYHSIDVLFVELVQVILWFNPLLFLFKRNVKLNHEFLADKAVLKQHVQAKQYQNTLLSYLSKDSAAKYQSINMANAINYSSIKKRFTVMKKETSTQSVFLRSLLLAPLVAVLLVGFSTREEVFTTPQNSISENTVHTARSISITILDDASYLVEGVKIKKHALAESINAFHQDISPEIRNRIMNIHLNSANTISREEVWFVYNALWDYGFHRLVTPDQEVIRSKGNTPLQVEKEVQTSASREQMKEYNTLAKKYNSMSPDNMRIKMKEVERMTYIYNLMSEKQRKDAAPFPDIPEPPAPPKTPNPNLAGTAVPAATSTPTSPKELSGEAKEVPPPPPPPVPKSPLEHVKEVAQKGAIFYFEGKEISASEAITLMEKDEGLNIVTNHTNDDDYVVRISREPIMDKE